MFYAGAKLCGKPFKAIVFAPRKEQARQDYVRFRYIFKLYVQVFGKHELIEDTKTRLVDSDLNSVSILHLTETADIEGGSGNFLIFEEAQGIEDEPLENKAYPMGANYGAPKVFIGTAGTALCKFYDVIVKGACLIFTFEDIRKFRMQHYIKDGNEQHLNYQKSVEADRQTMNITAYNRQYMNIWELGETQFITLDKFNYYSRTQTTLLTEPNLQVIYSLDQASKRDMAILRKAVYSPRTKLVELHGYLNLKGNYAEQKKKLKEVLIAKHFEYFIVDTTANQTAMTDFLVDEGIIPKDKLICFNYSSKSKSDMFNYYLQQLADEKIRFINPSPETRHQHCTAQKIYRSNDLLDVRAPKKKGFFDDIVNADAMAVYAPTQVKLKTTYG